MRKLRAWLWRLSSLLRRERRERDLADELASHLQLHIEDNLRAGMTPEEARRQALIKLGGMEQTKEAVRARRGIPAIEALRQDLRYGLRQLRRNPGFTAVAITTLALGIGATTAVFSMVNAVLLRPLPYQDPSRIVSVTEFFPKFNHSMVLTPEYAAWKRQNSTFEQLAAFGITVGTNLAGGGIPKRVPAGHVTPNLFSVLGVNPVRGHSFGDSGDTDHAVLLSYRLWQSEFASNPGIAGKSVTLDGTPYTVIGVLPAGFVYPDEADADIWLPDAVSPGTENPARSMGIVNVIGRLKPGVSRERAQADLEIIARRMDHQYPAPWSSYHAAAHVRVTSLHDALTRDARPTLLILAGAVIFILLIACANVANLLLARAVAREKEIAVRAAMGASRLRVVRLLLTESTLLGLSGGFLGIIFAWWATSAFRFLAPAIFSNHIPLDFHVLVFTLACSISTGIAFGLVPALTASKLDLNASLKEGGARGSETRSRSRLQAALVTSQLALSLVLLIGAGLLVRSFVLLLGVNPGFDPRQVLAADISLPPALYDPPRQAAFFRRALERVRSLPGVEYAAAADAPPMGTFNVIASGLQVEGQPESDATVGIVSISADYFRALRITLLRGRFFSERDADGTPDVAIINQALAHALFKNQDPIGRRITMNSAKGPWLTVVGEVADIRQRKLDDRMWSELYQPYLQSPAHWMTLVIRTASDALPLGPAVTKVVQKIDPAQPVFDVGTLDERLSETLAQRRKWAMLLGIFAAVGLLIAVVGLYGVVSYSMTRRTHEIGIRMALGAKRSDVLRLVLGHGFRLTLIGVGIGAISALGLTRFLSSLLYGVKPTDPLTFVAVSVVLASVALLASYIPARRATKVDPLVALRYE